MILSLALAVLVDPSLCGFVAVNMTSYQEGRRREHPGSPLTLMTGIQSSNSTCRQARHIAMRGRTRDMKFIKDKAYFDHPGYSLCLYGMLSYGKGRSEERY